MSDSRKSPRHKTPAFLVAEFTRAQRIRKRDEFVHAQRRGVPARGRYAVVLVCARVDTAPARLGVVASRKVGGAVRRNRSKRLVREWFRLAGVPAGLDVVVIADARMADATASELARDLDALLTRARGKAELRRPRPCASAAR